MIDPIAGMLESAEFNGVRLSGSPVLRSGESTNSTSFGRTLTAWRIGWKKHTPLPHVKFTFWSAAAATLANGIAVTLNDRA